MGRPSIPCGTPNDRQTPLCSCCRVPRNNLVFKLQESGAGSRRLAADGNGPGDQRGLGINAAPPAQLCVGRDRPLAEPLLRLLDFSPASCMYAPRVASRHGWTPSFSVQFINFSSRQNINHVFCSNLPQNPANNARQSSLVKVELQMRQMISVSFSNGGQIYLRYEN
jgi:hypothetical protein